MQSLSKLKRKLYKQFGKDINITEKDNIITLNGSLNSWDDVVSAGRMCADRKSRRYVVNNITCRNIKIMPMKTPSLSDDALDGKNFDVVVIGAGIVGCAISRELSKWNLNILLLEKEHDVALHASSRNDGMIHPGIDLKIGQVKQKYNALGNKMYDEICRELDVPFKRTGQYLGFTSKFMKYILPFAPRYWRRMDVPCSYVSKEELLKREPNLNENISCGLFFKTAGIVCPYGLTIAYAENAVDNGVNLSLDTAVLDMKVEDGSIKSIITNRGTVYPKTVINAAGVFSEDIAKMAKDHFFSIHPRKGTNSILDKKAAFQVKTIASLMGTVDTQKAKSKGGGVISTIDGNLLIGPDAIETYNKEDSSTDPESIKKVFERQKEISPLLSTSDIITYFTGTRAATYEEDFIIKKGHFTNNIVHAAGIQSPGLTAAPAIALDVAKMVVDLLSKNNSIEKNNNFNPYRKSIVRASELDIDERNKLINDNSDYGVIVCRCEEISKGEIVESLRRSVPCDTLDGIKRRVRAGMGRCQGGFCSPLIAQIIAEEKGIELKDVLKNGEKSNILYGSTKEGIENE
ncbi:MAG: NAD(P)/FAD-dependent oxidoreductase [Clostridium sp.]|uniref:NAD(P)/FAD-dependent oxidoreductase n=1 Tax=Clostridium sp. TaxID=1506 RepID=UPI0029068A46|nr:NAD(P)/FAD-dependent oxidoreductase [Clostridium sp.]MDU5109448.1 NAD(P)/FAD-dependent oxidoreductase [Clostridium sp.]